MVSYQDFFFFPIGISCLQTWPLLLVQTFTFIGNWSLTSNSNYPFVNRMKKNCGFGNRPRRYEITKCICFSKELLGADRCFTILSVVALVVIMLIWFLWIARSISVVEGTRSLASKSYTVSVHYGQTLTLCQHAPALVAAPQKKWTGIMKIEWKLVSWTTIRVKKSSKGNNVTDCCCTEPYHPLSPIITWCEDDVEHNPGIQTTLAWANPLDKVFILSMNWTIRIVGGSDCGFSLGSDRWHWHLPRQCFSTSRGGHR